VVAFTDWVEGPAGLTDGEAERFLGFMKFPNVQDIGGYVRLLTGEGCTVSAAEDTGRLAAHVDLYLSMLDMQLTYDALRILDFDAGKLSGMAKEMVFLQELAHSGKVVQGRFIARRQWLYPGGYKPLPAKWGCQLEERTMSEGVDSIRAMVRERFS